jgi:hypothetical protein
MLLTGSRAYLYELCLKHVQLYSCSEFFFESKPQDESVWMNLQCVLVFSLPSILARSLMYISTAMNVASKHGINIPNDQHGIIGRGTYE